MEGIKKEFFEYSLNFHLEDKNELYKETHIKQMKEELSDSNHGNQVRCVTCQERAADDDSNYLQSNECIFKEVSEEIPLKEEVSEEFLHREMRSSVTLDNSSRQFESSLPNPTSEFLQDLHQEMVVLQQQLPFPCSSSESESSVIDATLSSSDEYIPPHNMSSSNSSSSEDDRDLLTIRPQDSGQVPQASAQVPQDSNIESSQWKKDFVKRSKFQFCGNHGIQINQDGANMSPFLLFQQIIDNNIIRLMVDETNRFGQQQKNQEFKSKSRMNKWRDVSIEEMKIFIAVIFVTGLVKFPKMQDYWKLDPIFFHPLFHHIDMSYDRFSLILRNWHFSDKQACPPNDRLFKIANLLDMFIDNVQKLYIPGEEIVIDETQISHRGRLVFRQYNSGKRHKYGIKIYKLCDTTGYVWNAKVYCGTGSTHARPGLDIPGTVVMDLSERLLNTGRLLVTDNWCSTIELANQLHNKETEFCGTLRRNRKGLPASIMKKIGKNDIIGAENSNGIRIMKYADKKDVLMISTYHGKEFRETGKRHRNGDPIIKPSIIIDYNRVKRAIDRSDHMIEYYTPARKSIKWYRKVVYQLISIAALNSLILFNNFYNNEKMMTLEDCITSIVKGYLGEKGQIPAPQKIQKHELTQITRKEGKLVRKRCTGCYEKLSREKTRKEAQLNTKQVSTECQKCKKTFCLICFNTAHNIP